MLLIIICFSFYYSSTIKGLYSIWSTDDDYSYGFLIPLISAYLIWERRREIRETAISADWLGFIPFLLFLIFSLYGILGSSPSAVQPTIPLMLLSITLFCFGKAMFRKLFFPLAFLIFMIPLPTIVQDKLGMPLKLVSTKLGELILRLSGISVFVEGNVIDIGVTQLQVVDACGGLRFILPLLALGVLFACFFENIRWKQVVLVFITIPIAIITNGIRIGITGVLASMYGSSVAQGFFHGFSGWIVFMFAFALLFLFHFLFLKRVWKKTHRPAGVNRHGKEVDNLPDHIGSAGGVLPVVVCCLSLIVAGTLSCTTSVLPPIHVRGGMQSFPMTINAWQGKQEPMDLDIIQRSGAQDALNTVYTREGSPPISLYMGYRGSPFVESTNFFHSPGVCLPAAGWKTIDSSRYTIHNIPHFNDLTVSMMVIEKTGQRQLVYYWFQTKDHVSSNVNINRFHLALHAITRDNTCDLFIRPITPIYPGETVENAQKRMDRFVREMMAELLRFLKEKQYAD